MGETEGELKHLACGSGAVADTYEFHLFLVTFRYTYNHVVDKGAVETVHRTMLTLVVGTSHDHVITLYSYVDIGVDFL